MTTLLLKNGRVFDGEKFFNGDVLIENGKISAIGKMEQAYGVVIDCKNCIISSGLVDIHTHLSEMGNQAFGFPADMATIPFGVLYAVDACAEYTDVAYLDKLCVATAVLIPIQLQGETLNYEEMQRRLNLYGDKAIGVKVYFDESLRNGTTKEHLRLACKFARERNLKVMVHCSYSASPMAEIVELLKDQQK